MDPAIFFSRFGNVCVFDCAVHLPAALKAASVAHLLFPKFCVLKSAFLQFVDNGSNDIKCCDLCTDGSHCYVFLDLCVPWISIAGKRTNK